MTVGYTDIGHGSTSSNITDAWVFVDDDMIGVFELPAEIPFLHSGTHKLTIGAGIQVSATSQLRDAYPFYTAHIDENFDFIPGEVQNLNPEVQYREEGAAYEYYVIDDFEGVQMNLLPSSISDTGISFTNEPGEVFEGDYSGKIEFDNTASFVEIRTKERFILPAKGRITYLELDFKSDTPFEVGVFVNNASFQDEFVEYVTLNETNGEWRKVYINITTVIDNSIQPIDFYFYFLPFVSSSRAQSTILIDNFKLMYQL